MKSRFTAQIHKQFGFLANKYKKQATEKYELSVSVCNVQPGGSCGCPGETRSVAWQLT